MHKIFFFIALISFTLQSKSQSCTTVTPPAAPSGGSAASNNDNIGSGVVKYISSNQHFGKITVNSGGTLWIKNGATAEVNNLIVNNGTIYIETDATLTINANFTGTNRTIINYGDIVMSKLFTSADGDQIYNDGDFNSEGISFIGNTPLFTNTANGNITLSGNTLNINTSGFVNNGSIQVDNFNLISSGICMGDKSDITCKNFTNSVSNGITVNPSTAASIFIGNSATNSQLVTSTTGTLNVVFEGSSSSSNWGSSFLTSGSTSSPSSINTQKVFFSKSTGYLNDVATWGTELDGLGANPGNFTADYETFVIRNRTTADINADWTISGVNNILEIGDSVDAANFTVNGFNLNFTGKMIIHHKSSLSIAAAGSVTFQPGSILQLRSTVAGDGTIGQILGSLSGLNNNNVSVERFVPAKSSRMWSFLACPINAGSISPDWQDEIHITGPATNGTACSDASASSDDVANTDNGLDPNSTGNYSMFYADQSVAPNTTGQWKPVTNTLDNTAVFQLNRGNGFRVLVRGPRSLGCSLIGTSSIGNSQATTNVTLTAQGSLADVTNGSSFSLSYSTSNNNKYILIGNPYPSVLDFNAFATDASNSSIISNKYWLYSPENTSGTYTTYAAGITSNRPTTYANDGSQDNLIGSGQAFFIELATGGTSGTLTFKETHKYSTAPFTGTFGANNNSIKELLHVDLKTTNGNDLDGIAVRFVSDEKVTNTNYSNYDAMSMNAGAAQYLQSVKGNMQMAIHARHSSFVNDTVALNIVSRTSDSFQLAASGIESFANTNIYLLDKLNDTKTLLNDQPSYTFYINAADTTSFGSNRFQLLFAKTSNATIDNNVIDFKAFPSPVKDQLTITIPGTNKTYDLRILSTSGSALIQKQIASGVNNVSVNSLQNGMYIVEIKDDNGNIRSEKFIKMN